MSFDPDGDGPAVAETGDGPGAAVTQASPATEPATFPSISVVIPTYSMQRWEYLRECVASARGQTVPTLEIVVVVDHNPELLARVMREMPDVTAVENTGSRGVSGARNSGVKASRGDVVAFLDDDAIALPDWLANLGRHLLDPEVAGVGGHVEGLWEGPRPGWFPGEFGWTIGLSYDGMPTTPVMVRNVWTCAMLVKRPAFELVGGFRDDFGKIGTRSLPEDTDLCLRISSALDKGGSWVYDPATVIFHRVPAPRTTFGYFLSRCFLQGWGKAAMANMDGFGESTSMERSYASRTLPAGVGRGLKETVRGDFSGAARSMSIVTGLTFAVAGYVWYLQGRWRPLRKAGRDIGG